MNIHEYRLVGGNLKNGDWNRVPLVVPHLRHAQFDRYGSCSARLGRPLRPLILLDVRSSWFCILASGRRGETAH